MINLKTFIAGTAIIGLGLAGHQYALAQPPKVGLSSFTKNAKICNSYGAPYACEKHPDGTREFTNIPVNSPAKENAFNDLGKEVVESSASEKTIEKMKKRINEFDYEDFMYESINKLRSENDSYDLTKLHLEINDSERMDVFYKYFEQTVKGLVYDLYNPEEDLDEFVKRPDTKDCFKEYVHGFFGKPNEETKDVFCYEDGLKDGKEKHFRGNLGVVKKRLKLEKRLRKISKNQ